MTILRFLGGYTSGRVSSGKVWCSVAMSGPEGLVMSVMSNEMFGPAFGKGLVSPNSMSGPILGKGLVMTLGQLTQT